jgi:hypothetical protein
MRIKKTDPRLRRAILSLDVEHAVHQPNGVEGFMHQLIADCANLISSISDRTATDGLSGHKKNYETCRRIAALRIKLEQATMVWATDNIDTFDKSMMRVIEETVRARRSELPMRKDWPRCKECGGLVHPRKSQNSEPFDRDDASHLRVASLMDNEPSRIYTCHKCVD